MKSLTLPRKPGNPWLGNPLKTAAISLSLGLCLAVQGFDSAGWAKNTKSGKCNTCPPAGCQQLNTGLGTCPAPVSTCPAPVSVCPTPVSTCPAACPAPVNTCPTNTCPSVQPIVPKPVSTCPVPKASCAPAATCPTPVSSCVGGCPSPVAMDIQGYSLAAQGVTPAIRGRVTNEETVDPESKAFRARQINDVYHREAPRPGQSRGAIEAAWGPSKTSIYTPGRDVSIYVNNQELIDGHLMNRYVPPQHIKVYEVVYCDSKDPLGSSDAPAISVTPVMMPRVGDHRNMFSLFLNEPTPTGISGSGQGTMRAGNWSDIHYFGIPQEQYKNYRSITDNPFVLVKTFTDTNGIVVAQEFVPRKQPWASHYGFSSAHRYTE